MKPEVYSCLKMLEDFNKNCTNIFYSHNFSSANSLRKQYCSVTGILKKHLKEEDKNFIPDISDGCVSYNVEEAWSALIQELISASGMLIAFLKSMEGSLDREMEEKRKNLELREKEIEWKEKFVNKALQGIKDLPELQRSKIVESIKKSHREIEKHSKKKPEILFAKTEPKQ